MKKITILLVVTCMLLSSCGVRISMADEDVDIESSVGLFNQHSSFYDRYSAQKDETTCKVKGTLHQAADDRNAIITYVTAQDGIGSMTVTGSMNCTKGSLRLVYMAPDGTETLISDGSVRKIDAQIDVAEGEGSIEDIGLDEIEDNWPESIRYNGNGVYADPMSVNFEIDEPMALSVSCLTTGGKLRLKIVDNSNFGETVYFDENDPKGTYTVDIDKKGIYKVLIYAKYHNGSVEITPVKE